MRNDRAADTKAPEGTDEVRPFNGPRASASCSPWSPPGPSFGCLATSEPGSRDLPEDRSSNRSGGSHLPLRARRNVWPGPWCHKALVHELATPGAKLIPELPTIVDDLWIHFPGRYRDEAL